MFCPTDVPAPAPAEGPELGLGLGLAVGPLPEARPVGERGADVGAVEAPGHHGQQQDHRRQETREPERVVTHRLQVMEGDEEGQHHMISWALDLT